MPASYPNGKEETKKWVIAHFPTDTPILDVGPGEGTYFNLLSPLGYTNLSAVEIFTPYIFQFSLSDKYKEIINANIIDVTSEILSKYKLIIMGDILEHLTFPDADKLVTRIINETSVKGMIVSVPYCYPQGAWGGNIYETHLQPDITETNMLERYPYLTPLKIDRSIGVYTFLRSNN